MSAAYDDSGANAEESPAYQPPDSPEDAKPWLALISDAEHCFEKWQQKCDTIDDLYAKLDLLGNTTADREFRIFWANMEVMRPSIYARPAIPVVVPKFKDRSELARRASEMLERALISVTEANDGQLHEACKLVRDDLAIHARGVLWLRNSDTMVEFDQLDRGDFLHEPARKWHEVGWVARRDWLTRRQMRQRFPDTEEDWLQSAVFKERKDSREDYKGEQKAGVWQIWSRPKRVVVWITEGVEVVLDQRTPGEAPQDGFLPLPNLENFFPCPKPAYATLQRRSLIPVPDFLYYKDQVEEINEMTARISSLAEALKMKGFYPSGAGDLAQAIENVFADQENRAVLVGVSNFAALGGSSLKESIVWLPVQDVATVITELVALRRQLIEDVYQITGLSDIMRGQTDPNETLGAQELKAQTGAVRIREKQAEMIRLARDAIRMAGEIMAENFSPEALLNLSQIKDLPSAQVVQQQAMQAVQQQTMQIDQMIMQARQNPQVMQQVQANPQLAQQALQKAQAQKQQIQQQAQQQMQQAVTMDKVVELLRSEKVRPFVLDIETDSTIQPDENAEKQRRTEFITAVGGFIGQVVPVAAQLPEIAPLAASMLKFLSAGFRAGRELEGEIEKFAETVEQKASQPQPPSPEAQAAQAKAQAEQQKAQMAQQKQQADQEIAQAKMVADQQAAQAKQAAEQQKAAMAQEKQRADTELAMQYMRADMQKQQHDAGMQVQELTAKFALDMQAGQLDMQKTRAEIEKIYAEIERIGAQAKAAAQPKPEAKAA
jgi:hypothetical protein